MIVVSQWVTCIGLGFGVQGLGLENYRHVANQWVSCIGLGFRFRFKVEVWVQGLGLGSGCRNHMQVASRWVSCKCLGLKAQGLECSNHKYVANKCITCIGLEFRIRVQGAGILGMSQEVGHVHRRGVQVQGIRMTYIYVYIHMYIYMYIHTHGMSQSKVGHTCRVLFIFDVTLIGRFAKRGVLPVSGSH